MLTKREHFPPIGLAILILLMGSLTVLVTCLKTFRWRCLCMSLALAWAERVWVFQCAGLCVCCIGTPKSQNRRAAIKDQIQVSLFWSPRDSLRCAVQPIGNWAAKRAAILEAWLCCCCCCYCCFTVVVLHCGFCCSQSEAHGNWCIQ